MESLQCFMKVHSDPSFGNQRDIRNLIQGTLVNSSDEHREETLMAARSALARGHQDAKNLREILIWTTSKTTSDLVEAYFAEHLNDSKLIEALVSIALEGDDAGDAPWAAANTLTRFPAAMLLPHTADIIELSKYDWIYLSSPAKKILAKLGYK
jgi:hypothetical protein